MSVLATRRPPEIDLDLQNVVLDVVNKKIKHLDTRINQSIVDGEIERTIEGASTLTLTVHDPKRALLQSGMFEYVIQIRLDRLFWRLVKVSKSGDDLDLVFEDREVALLRQHAKPKKAARAKMTRAMFALSLVREVKSPRIPFVCPELRTVQPITSSKMEKTTRDKQVNAAKGLAEGVNLSIKGKLITRDQRRNAETILDVADSHGADEKATLALVCACIVESSMRNLSGGDRDSRGILQVRDSTAKGAHLNNRDVAACAAAFLQRGFWGKGGAIALSRQHSDWSAGQIAQATQGSAFPERYDKVRTEARRIVDAYTGGVENVATTVTRSVRLPYQFRRGTPDGRRENSWTALTRLAEEVHWHCFMSAGRLYFISENALLKAKPRLVVNELTPGVTNIDFDLDSGKAPNTATITCRASRWFVAPGAVVQLIDCGPADGRWLVAGLRRGIFDADAEITLKRPELKLKEPAADTKQKTFKTTSRAAQASSGQITKAYQAAKNIDSHRYPYVWGGGHAKAAVPSGSPPGYDCSGSTVAVLAKAGMGFDVKGGTATSSGLMDWGEAGPGNEMTVWANQQHVFIVFHIGSKKEHFGTGDWGKGWGGAGFNPRLHPTDRFKARHWPGT